MTLEDLLVEAARLGVVSLWFDPVTGHVCGVLRGVWPRQLVCTISVSDDSCDSCGGSGGDHERWTVCTACGGSGRNT